MIRLRATQFREDAGPLAHPVRPEEYVEINNFYTATVYEKGAEVIGMLRRLVGPETYARALDLYFERHDGQACTIEDWLAGLRGRLRPRPRAVQALVLAGRHPAAAASTERWDGGRYTLELAQATPPTPGQPDKAPLVIPVAYGLLEPRRRGRWPRACSSSTEAAPVLRAGTCPPARCRRCCAASRRR